MASSEGDDASSASTCTIASTVPSLQHNIQCRHPREWPPASAFNSIITVTVIESPSLYKRFYIHRGVLRFYSGFFDRALNSGYSEAESSEYEVTDTSIATFQICFDLMNTGISSIEQEDLDPEALYTQAIDLFVFADFYVIPVAKNYATDMFFGTLVTKWSLGWPILSQVYDKLYDCEMKKLAVHMFTETRCGSVNLKDIVAEHDLTLEMVVDIYEAHREKKLVPGADSPLAAGKRAWLSRFEEDFCERYHDHVGVYHQDAMQE